MITPTDILLGKILIVDDLATNIALLEGMLRNAGFTEISSTTDPSKVCEMHLINHYDLILLDLQMPEMDGFQVMENLKEIEVESYLPVLVITAQPAHKLRALQTGAKDFISKPFDLAEVILRVRNMVEVRLLHMETKRLYEKVLDEQRASERLLLNVVPHSVLERLKSRGVVTAEGPTELITGGYAEVTALFADIVEFTKFAEGASAIVMEEVLNGISARFEGAGLNRPQVIGDAYLAMIELSDSLTNHTVSAVQKALDLAEAMDRFNAHSNYKLKIQIGFDTNGAKRRDNSMYTLL